MSSIKNNRPFGVNEYIDFENALNDDKYYPFDKDGQLSFDKVVAFLLKAGYVYNKFDDNWYLLNREDGLYYPIDEKGVFLDIIRFVSAQSPEKNVASTLINSIRDRLKGVSKPYMDRLREDFLTYHDEYCLSWEQPDFIPVRNGLIHPESMEIVPHCAHFLYPNVLNFNYQKLSYDDIENSPIYDVYLQILPDIPTLEFYLWWVGAVLFCPDMLRMCVCLIGEGGTGKTTLSLGITQILTHNLYHELNYQSLKNNNRFFTSSLQGKKLAILDEMSSTGGSLDDGLIKQVTGGNPYMTVEEKYKGFKTVPITSKYLMIGNSFPSIKQDGALRQRMFFIGCHKKQDSSIRKLVTSDDALNWLFNAAHYFYVEKHKHTEVSDLSQLKTQSMLEEEEKFCENDPYTYWISEWVGSNKKEDIQLRLDGEITREIYNIYCRSMSENGSNALRIQNFSQRVCSEHDMITASTTIQGEKIRIFRKKQTA